LFGMMGGLIELLSVILIQDLKNNFGMVGSTVFFIGWLGYHSEHICLSLLNSIGF